MDDVIYLDTPDGKTIRQGPVIIGDAEAGLYIDRVGCLGMSSMIMAAIGHLENDNCDPQFVVEYLWQVRKFLEGVIEVGEGDAS